LLNRWTTQVPLKPREILTFFPDVTKITIKQGIKKLRDTRRKMWGSGKRRRDVLVCHLPCVQKLLADRNGLFGTDGEPLSPGGRQNPDIPVQD
jgi:hypothetical protein